MPCDPLQHHPRIPPTLWAFTLTLAVLVFLNGCSPRPEPLSLLPPDAVILAYGDSLTAGTGAEPPQSYPAQLERLTGHRVVNAGRPGEVSAAGLERLPALLDQHEPRLLILAHGGNDLLRRMDSVETRRNLAEMVALARAREIEVLLVAVPAPTLLRLRNEPLYAELASELRIPIEEHSLAHVLSQDDLKADPIHPNADGYRYLAESIHRLLLDTGAILAR
jgi:acyl-CoA thioesterase I